MNLENSDDWHAFYSAGGVMSLSDWASLTYEQRAAASYGAARCRAAEAFAIAAALQGDERLACLAGGVDYDARQTERAMWEATHAANAELRKMEGLES